MTHARFPVLLTTLLLMAVPVMGQDAPPEHASLDSLFLAHRHALSIQGGEAGGPGFDLLVEAARDDQFFVIAEEHNLLELNQLTVAIFDTLQARYGFQHLVLEQGEIITSWLDEAARTGGADSVRAVVRRYPHAPTFATDQELELMAHVRQRSTAAGAAVWGVDQELAAMHLLERLAALTDDAHARAEFLRLAAEARPHEEVRTGDVHYLFSVADPDEYAALTWPGESREADEGRAVFDALNRTVRIYTGRRNALGRYDSNRTREASMRLRFMEHYRRAVGEGPPPRAIVKMGHWHTLRGFHRADVPTFGNFLSEFAVANGLGSTVVSTYVINSPDAWRNSGATVQRAGTPDGISVIDLRPLRPLAHLNRIADLSPGWRDLIFQADFLLIIGGGRTGSYHTAHGTG